MRLMGKALLTMFVLYMVSGVSMAAEDDRQQRTDSLNAPSSGRSFREGQVNDGAKEGVDLSSGSEMTTKGAIITEPSMSGLTYQVHILGEVKKAGTYRITASDRLSEVLMMAGGVDKQGSQRNIEVRRKGEGTRKVDLVKFQIFGNLNDNPYLLDNDVVYIPLKTNVIQVVGAVKRPMEYEVKQERNLSDAIKLAGGFTVGVSKDSPVRVVRFVDGKKEVLEVSENEDEMSGFRIQNGDVIFAPHVIIEKNKFDYNVPKLPGDNIFYPSYEDRVFILGGVAQPGAYPFNPYYKMSQYLSLAGGYTQMSTKRVAVLTSEGKKRSVRQSKQDDVVINPGDTLLVGQRRIPPEGWMSIIMGIAGFGLSTTATVLALTR